MAIYHFSVKNISRAQGRSAVACAAYRSGEKLIDERQGKEQDYTKKTGVELTRIYAPVGTKAELLERGQLWNAVEKTERRKDANLAREFEIALPQELNKAEREKLVDELCNKIVERHSVIVDAAIHAPHTDSGSDERNYHAHIMFTGRQIDLETGDFATKKNRDFNKENSSETVQKWREDFADMTNTHLMRAGHLFSSVDHRSYAAQGIDKEATAHEGSAVTQLRRLGIDTEISLSNDAIKQRNAERNDLPKLISGLEQEIIASERIIAKLEQQQLEQRTAAEPSIEQIYSQLNDEQRHAYKVMQTAIQQRFDGQEQAEKIQQLNAKFIEKYKENPSFAVPPQSAPVQASAEQRFNTLVGEHVQQQQQAKIMQKQAEMKQIQADYAEAKAVSEKPAPLMIGKAKWQDEHSQAIARMQHLKSLYNQKQQELEQLNKPKTYSTSEQRQEVAAKNPELYKQMMQEQQQLEQHEQVRTASRSNDNNKGR